MSRTRPAFAQINLSNLQHNYLQAKQHSPNEVYAVIKADAYGHGITQIAQALDYADGFAVACVDEALRLREQNIGQPILVLQGAYCSEDWQLASAHNLQMVVHHLQQLQMLENVHVLADAPIQVWLKINTGMNRVGIRPEQVELMVEQIQTNPKLKLCKLMTHHACSDEQDLSAAQTQLENFYKIDSQATTSIASSSSNSAAILAGLNGKDDISRAGIMLYGSSPFCFKSAKSLNLKPVMNLYSQVISIHEVSQGEAVGYGGRFIAAKDTKIAVVAMGYGDGYPRHAPDGTPVYINGQRCELAGKVSMDMLTVDVSECEGVKIGSRVELWGENLSVDEVAACSQTIAYELFCRLTPRIPRQYID